MLKEKFREDTLTPIDSLRGFLYARAPVDSNYKHCFVLVLCSLMLPTTPAFMQAPIDVWGGSDGAYRSDLLNLR